MCIWGGSAFPTIKETIPTFALKFRKAYKTGIFLLKTLTDSIKMNFLRKKY